MSIKLQCIDDKLAQELRDSFSFEYGVIIQAFTSADRVSSRYYTDLATKHYCCFSNTSSLV